MRGKKVKLYVGMRIKHTFFGVGVVKALGYIVGDRVERIPGQVTCEFNPDNFGRHTIVEVRNCNLTAI